MNPINPTENTYKLDFNLTIERRALIVKRRLNIHYLMPFFFYFVPLFLLRKKIDITFRHFKIAAFKTQHISLFPTPFGMSVTKIKDTKHTVIRFFYERCDGAPLSVKLYRTALPFF